MVLRPMLSRVQGSARHCAGRATDDGVCFATGKPRARASGGLTPAAIWAIIRYPGLPGTVAHALSVPRRDFLDALLRP